jgi:hypothetical protein
LRSRDLGNVPLGVANLLAACLLVPTLYVKLRPNSRPAWVDRWNQRIDAKAAA